MIGVIAEMVMRSAWGRYIMAGLALLAGLKVWSEVRERDGRNQEAARRAVETIRQLRRMSHVAANVRTDRAGVVERLRDGTF